MADGEEDPAVFTSTSLPSDPRLLATVTNAYLGTRVYRDILHVNGVYNGAAGDTHRADIPSPVNVRMTVPGADSLAETFTLNTRTGTFSHVLQTTDYAATQQIFAHHSLVHLMAFSITIQRSAHTTQPITVQLQTPFVPKSQDLDLNRGPDFQGAHYVYGKTLVPEVEGGPRPAIHMLWAPVPPALTLGGEERERSWEFLTAVAGSEEEAKRSYGEGLALIATGSLHASHAHAWATLWGGCCVDLDGPLPLRQALCGCLYYLLSSIPPRGSPGFLFHGISPGGLSNGTRGEDYWGHVFWDQDTWMFPNILLFYPEAARAILEYRIRTLEGALHNAQEQGYEGAKFPWESAATGREVCPEEIYGAQEIHITGDVLMAFEQYYYTTQDQKLFREDGGWKLVGAVAQYWCSRMVWSKEEQCYHIKGVMPPDEYHYRVDNSVYTNVLAQRSLNFAADVARDFLIPVPEEWVDCAKKIKVPFDAEKKYHPEYDGYSPGSEASAELERRVEDVCSGSGGCSCGDTLKLLLYFHPRGRQLLVKGGFFSPAEHVCSGLAGAKGDAESSEPTEQVFQQHHGALQDLGGELRWVRSCELLDRDGWILASCPLWLHRVQDHKVRPPLQPCPSR
ncbi:protein-glucosylgalactosylhydroxylysine glucosidase isoform X2 [Tyto alba]|uniref:protein-glucosylgalactosylhydroxylysine glucosidase isoform X2 n=1 Tax=Tyto alba TaxID=56313 RepID=UPI001C6792FD|nr:protein-glucosylgalactosylhydroxylysine glucosidase isoform X2 [Tyto alba]